MILTVRGRLLVDDLPGENKPAAGTPPYWDGASLRYHQNEFSPPASGVKRWPQVLK